MFRSLWRLEARCQLLAMQEVITLHTQASATCAQGRTEKSRKLNHKALALAREHFPADSTVVATIQAEIWASYLVHVHQVPPFSLNWKRHKKTNCVKP